MKIDFYWLDVLKTCISYPWSLLPEGIFSLFCFILHYVNYISIHSFSLIYLINHFVFFPFQKTQIFFFEKILNKRKFVLLALLNPQLESEITSPDSSIKLVIIFISTLQNRPAPFMFKDLRNSRQGELSCGLA